MARKACFEDFYKNISKELIGDDVSEDYDYLCNMFLYFEEALTFFKFEDSGKSFRPAHIDNVAKNILPADFAKLVPLAEGNCFYNAVSMLFFFGKCKLCVRTKN